MTVRTRRTPGAMLGRALLCGAAGGGLLGGVITAPELVSSEWRGLFPLGLAYGIVIGAGLALLVVLTWLALDHVAHVPTRLAPLVVAGLTATLALLAVVALLDPRTLTEWPVWVLFAYTAAVAAFSTRYITTRRKPVGHDEA